MKAQFYILLIDAINVCKSSGKTNKWHVNREQQLKLNLRLRLKHTSGIPVSQRNVTCNK